MAEYRLGERAYDGDDPDLQFALKAAHGGDVRPLCLCRQFDAMLPMVIEHRAMNGADLYLLRRMPGQGHLHTPACRHYEAPEGLSGRADHLGAAIKTEDEGAHHKLRLGFPLSHQERVASEDDAVEPKAPARLRQLYARLSLTGFLHHILETAELNKMHKGLHDKRGWAVMRGRILEAMASQSTARYRDLADYAFCPRVFSVERKDELFRDWRAIERKAGAEKRAIILFAELKDIDGGQLIFKHLPQRAFAVKPDIQKPFLDTLDQITGLMTGPRGAGHVLCCALVTVGEGDVLSIADIAMARSLSIRSSSFLSPRQGFRAGLGACCRRAPSLASCPTTGVSFCRSSSARRRPRCSMSCWRLMRSAWPTPSYVPSTWPPERWCNCPSMLPGSARGRRSCMDAHDPSPGRRRPFERWPKWPSGSISRVDGVALERATLERCRRRREHVELH